MLRCEACHTGAGTSRLLQLQDAVEEFSKYTTLALFNFVDVCDGMKPTFNPAAPIPALPVDSQVGGAKTGGCREGVSY